MLGGHIDAMVASPTIAVPYLHAGRLRALGLGGPRRQPQVPDVPTFHEAGLRGFDMTCYHGLWFPAGAASDIIRRVNAEVAKAVALPDVKKYLADNGLIPTGTSPEEFAAFIRKDIARQAGIVKQIGLQPQ
jgi:tripartite-type tricarboxylate transporter receptor subunit TctC